MDLGRLRLVIHPQVFDHEERGESGSSAEPHEVLEERLQILFPRIYDEGDHLLARVHAASQQEIAQHAPVRLGVVHRQTRILHEPFDIREECGNLLVVQMAFGDGKNGCPLARLMETDTGILIDVHAPSVPLLGTHRFIPEREFQLVAIIKNLRARDDFENATDQRFPHGSIHRS